jgi:DNA primase catalytic core
MIRYTDLTAVINHVKASIDILKLIVEDTGRKPASSGTSDNNFIMCPLHEEKNKPSFNINTRLQAYRCFGGCSDGGDAIRWCQVWHGLSAPEAVDYLATRFNIDVGSFIRQATDEERKRDRLVTVFRSAIQYCHRQLVDHPTLYTWYKDDTGFDDDVIAQYGVGYCPSVEAMVSYLFKSVPGLSQAEVKALELTDTRQWNHALVYPVHDIGGVPLRAYTKPLSPPADAAYKYLGTSSQHPLFKKDLVYGLAQVRRHLRNSGKNGKVVLTEGFKAAIAAGAVAVMGTETSIEQADLLRSVGVRHITCCFDGDHAGYMAGIRVVGDLSKFKGMLVKIAQLPLDQQCDSIVKSNGRDALDAVIANAKLPIEFYVSTKFNISGTISLEDKYQILADAAPIVARMTDAESDITAEYLSGILGTEPDSIKTYIRDTKVTASKLVNIQAEEDVLHYTILEPTNLSKLKSGLVTEEYFSLSDHQKIYKAIEKAHKEFQANLTAKLIADILSNTYPKDAERLKSKVGTIVAAEPQYAFDVAATLITDLWRRRTSIAQADDLKSHMMDLAKTPLEALNKFRRVTISGIDVRDNQAITPQRVADKVDRIIAERQAMGTEIIGFDFGSRLPLLNRVLSGLQKGHQLVIAANQSVGKSLLAMNMVEPIAIEQRVPWLWINQEMPEEDLAMRAISIRSGINNNKLQLGKFTQDEYFAYLKARDDLARSNLYFRRPISGDIDEIYSIIEEFKFKYGIEGVTWDYAQLVMSTRDQRGASREEVVSHASNVFTNRVAGDLGLHSMMISQLNRQNYEKGTIREAESVGNSYKIAQDAMDFITIAEKTAKQIEEDGRDRGNRLIYIDKRRGGPADITLHADVDTHTTFSLRFNERANQNEILGFMGAFA